nr:MAG TPA: hypothetical protein [Caudoviricetes sp.]
MRTASGCCMRVTKKARTEVLTLNMVARTRFELVISALRVSEGVMTATVRN